MSPSSNPIVLFDGVCGFCQASVRYLLDHDPQHVLRFAPLQSEFAQKALTQRGHDPTKLDTVYVIDDSNPDAVTVYKKSDAAVFILRALGWRITAGLINVVPRFLRNIGYDLFASVRYRLFGRTEACFIPSPSERAQFIEQA